MKQGIVKFSKEFVTPIGLKEWASVEYEFDMQTEDPLDVFARAKKDVCTFQAQEALKGIDLGWGPNNAPPTEIPVINKEHERLEMLIDNSKSIEELMGYKNNLSSPFLANCFWTKHQQLVLQPNK